MAFQSLGFIAFLAGSCVLFWVALPRWKRFVILLASCAFYASYRPRDLAILFFATTVAHLGGLGTAAAGETRRGFRIAVSSVAVLLLLLGVFKYLGATLGAIGAIGPARLCADIVAPLGVSYYIFKLVSYVLDVHWERTQAERSWLAIATYAAFFPQILSGPIQRADDFLTQTRELSNPTLAQVQSGARMMLFGFFKKLVIADRIGEAIDPVFAAPHSAEAVRLLIVAYLFAIQLYADFSGLTDIAIGLGRLFNVESPQNFDAPYLAGSVTEFWRRWHMTLTSWLTDYLFTPIRHALRGLGDAGLVIALMLNMMAIGLWHGPRLTYVVFGALNGVLLSASALTLKRRNRWFRNRPQLARMRRVWGPVLTFHLMAFCFVFFRARTIADAGDVVARASSAWLHPRQLTGGILHVFPSPERLVIVAAGMVVMACVHAARRREWLAAWFASRPVWVRWSAYYGAAAAIALFGVFGNTFIYVQF